MKLWIARNIDNTLVLFQSKPIINNNGEWDEILNEDYMFIPEYLYPEVTFENSPNILECRLQFTGGVPSELVPEIKLAPPQNKCIDFVMFPYIGQALIGDDMKTLAESLPETDKETDFYTLIEDII